MSHIGIILTEPGSGPGGEAEAEIRWFYADGLSHEEIERRARKARKLLRKANGILYGHDEYPDEE